jgi:transcriptional regulator with XRE-family HTH domain
VSSGLRIRLVRQWRGLTQAELAERVGWMSPESVSRVERRNVAPTVERLREVARALDVPLDVLLGDGPLDEAEWLLLDHHPAADPAAVSAGPDTEDLRDALDAETAPALPPALVHSLRRLQRSTSAAQFEALTRFLEHMADLADP